MDRPHFGQLCYQRFRLNIQDPSLAQIFIVVSLRLQQHIEFHLQRGKDLGLVFHEILKYQEILNSSREPSKQSPYFNLDSVELMNTA